MAFQDFDHIHQRHKAERDKKFRKRVTIAAIVAFVLLILIAGAVVAAVIITKNNSKSEDKGGGKGGGDNNKPREVSKAQKLVKTICDGTNYKESCTQTLIKTAEKNPSAQPIDFFKAIIFSTSTELENTFKRVGELKSSAPEEEEGIKVCKEVVERATGDKEKALGDEVAYKDVEKLSTRAFDMNNLLSSILSYQQICVDCMPEGKMKDEVVKITEHSKELTSVSLAIIREYSTYVDTMMPADGPGSEAPTSADGPSSEAPNVAAGPGSEAPKAADGPGSEAPKPAAAPGAEAPNAADGPASEAPTPADGTGSEAPKAADGPGSEALKAADAPGSKAPKAAGAPGSEAPETADAPGAETPKAADGPGTEAPKTADGSSLAAAPPGTEAPKPADGESPAGSPLPADGGEKLADAEAKPEEGQKPPTGLGHNRRLLKFGIPTWINEKFRRIMQQEDHEPGNNDKLTPNVTVAKDGSGQCNTITEALNAIPENYDGRYVIYVKEGVYEENVRVEQRMENVTMYGDGSQKTIVTGNKAVTKDNKVNLYDTATFATVASGFFAKSIGFRNTAGNEAEQAVALRVEGDDSVFQNCRIEGHQNTLWTAAHKQYYRSCRIFGTVDVIFGDAKAYFQNCVIKVKKPREGQSNTITAQGRPDDSSGTGIVLHNCTIQADESLQSDKVSVKSYLGRPGKEYARVIVLESTIGDVIDPLGWLEAKEKFEPKKLELREYENKGPGAKTDGRVKLPGLEIIKEKKDVSKYTLKPFLHGDSWINSTGGSVPAGFGLFN